MFFTLSCKFSKVLYVLLHIDIFNDVFLNTLVIDLWGVFYLISHDCISYIHHCFN